MNISDIIKLLPHRYPFLLVDKIIEIEEKKIVGIKNVTMNENFFQGHFPENPIMPGVLLIEAMAQVGAVGLLRKNENKDKLLFLVGVDKIRFRKPVFPGDRLNITVEFLSEKKGIGKVKGEIKVDDEIVAEGELLYAMREK
jgi:3-hydroxyacyl-[acyl-carrier-protein] dehydratase